MVKAITIDDDVAALIKRIGALPDPKNKMCKYSIDRSSDGLTVVTVQLFADNEFCSPQTENGE